MRKRLPGFRYWWLAAAAAVILRVWALRWGLPHTFNADEPHLVNLAASFGGGSLSPHSFKYPTLWPYLLGAAYGAFFIPWSGFGLLRGVPEFIALFAWRPSAFYLIGRGLSAAFGLAGLWALWKAEEDRREPGLPWAALLLAVSPTLVELAHSAKPDGLMFFLACLGWRAALRVQREGDRRAHLLCGLYFGLAASSQYHAAPAALALPLAHAFSQARPPRRRLWEGLACAAAGFLLGTPYALLDFPRFLAAFGDLAALGGLEDWDRGLGARFVLGNLGTFAGSGSVAGVAALWGAWRLWRKNRPLLGLLGLPVLAYAVLLANNADGGWPRYLLGAYPALALLASEGLRGFERAGRPARRWALAALALVPGLVLSAGMDLRMSLPDTRERAREWVEANIPMGAVILLDLPHAAPRLEMARAQVLELAEKTAAAGSPRARLYRGMAEAHPGGGWRLYRVARTARDLRSSPGHVRASQADWPVLEVEEGLPAAKAAKVEFVITSSFGASPERSWELTRFFEQLERQGRLLAEFRPEPGESEGPVLRVFRLPR